MNSLNDGIRSKNLFFVTSIMEIKTVTVYLNSTQVCFHVLAEEQGSEEDIWTKEG
jgi:hypothetical protein